MSDPFNPYAELYINPQGPGDKRPTAMRVLEDSNLLNAWPDKVVMITGATSGIGVETARAMYATGAQVYLMVRNPEKAAPIVADITSSTVGRGRIDVIEMDNDSLASVKRAAREFLSKSSRLHVLINNAGIMACPRSTTADGHERHFGVNYLAHFTLTLLLLPALLSSSPSRILWLSSPIHRLSPPSHIPPPPSPTPYDPLLAYSRSKLAMIWASNHLHRLYHARGLRSLALSPGAVWSENLLCYAAPAQRAAWQSDGEMMRRMQNTAQGAATSVWAATAGVWGEEGRGGRYLVNCSEAGPGEGDDGFGANCYDEEGEERLWRVSLEMVGLEGPVV
ncbi:putative short-chain dehydrogenase [Camillea tinctor]|nr:putative short-chain dehydrogenase [Camillea tinctor]